METIFRSVRLKQFFKFSSAICLTLLLTSLTAQATTVVMLSDEDLIVSSRAIVRGKVVGVEGRFDDDYSRIYTYVTVEIKSVLKGKIKTDHIVLRQLGGQAGDRFHKIFGAPEFKLGENVLLFLDTADDGAFRVAQLFMGKYSVVRDEKSGLQFARRLIDGEIRIFDKPKSGEITNEMLLSEYTAKIKRTLVERADRVAQFDRKYAGRPMLEVPKEYIPSPQSRIEPNFGFLGSGFRWFEADTSTPIPYRLNSANAPVAGGGMTEFNNSLAAWTNIASASIILQNAGTTTSCGFVLNGVSAVSFGDCRNEIPDPVNCGGTLAIGGVSGTFNQTIVVNGKTFTRIAEGDLVFNNNFECFLGNSSNLAEVMTHEIGHSIGMGHSSENSNESNATLRDATMFFQAHGDGRGASVRADDIAGSAFIYPVSSTPVITGISPLTGKTGDQVTITGTDFGTPSSVKFGTGDGTVVSSSETQIVATVSANAATGKIVISFIGGTSATSADTFTVVKPATISSFTPLSGAVGTTVTITGTNLSNVTAVFFNGVSAGAPQIVSATSIKAVVPANGTTGKISANNLAGAALSVSTFKVTPKINDFTPTNGISGTTFTITGTTLKIGSTPPTVKIGSVTATVNTSSATSVVAVIPATAITGKVSVATADGTATSTNDLVVIKPPTVTSFTPASGPVGTLVTVNGTNFLTLSQVLINGVNVGTLQTVTSTSFKFVVPSGAATDKISVTNPAGSIASALSFKVTPKINSVAPNNVISGESFTVTGLNLMTGATTPTVRIGSIAATVTNSTATSVTATTPATAITGKVSVVTADGTGTSTTDLIVVRPPTISSFTPLSGPVDTLVTINGTNLSSVTQVLMNGVNAGTPQIVSASQIRVAIPAGATTGKFSVTNRAGSATSVGTFKVSPKITSVAPGSAILGASFTVTGLNLMVGATTPTVRIGSVTATVTNSTATSVTATVPATAITGKVSVLTIDGTGTSTTDLIVIRPPTITSFTPTLAPVGTVVTINGTNLSSVSQVFINGLSAGAPQIVSASQMKITIPAGATTGKFSAVNPAGTVTGTTVFKVTPKINAMTPGSGLVGETFIITGTNLKIGNTNAVVRIGSTLVPFDTATATDTQITVAIPSNAITGKVMVSTADGNGTSATDFIVIKQPVISSLSPLSGKVGALITISGQNLSSATDVKFGNASVTAPITIVTASQIRVNVPAGATTGKVTLVNRAGTAVSVSTFTVLP